MAADASDRAQFLEWRPGVMTRMHAAHSTGAESLCVIEQICEPGAGAPWHRHDGVEEVIVVVQGRGSFLVAGDATELEEGGSVRIPPGLRHAFTNVGETPLRVIAIFGSPLPVVEYEHEPGVLEIGRHSGRHRTPVEESGA